MSYEIDKGVAIPNPRQAAGGRPAIYPWREMGVGDSFLVSLNGDTTRKVQRRMTSLASAAAQRLGFRFSTRIVDGGVRVWRTA